VRGGWGGRGGSGAGAVTERFAVKSNIVYAIGGQTPNVEFEYFLPGGRMSLAAAAGYNKWGNFWDSAATGPDYDPANLYKRRLDHLFVKVEYRYRFGGRMSGHFAGAGGFFARYNVGELRYMGLFDDGFDYYGNLFGLGVSYGYLWRWGGRWGTEFTLGGGVAVLNHDKSMIMAGPEQFTLVNPLHERKIYFGPTNIGIKLVFFIR
jgi:hypothetical protein